MLINCFSLSFRVFRCFYRNFVKIFKIFFCVLISWQEVWSAARSYCSLIFLIALFTTSALERVNVLTQKQFSNYKLNFGTKLDRIRKNATKILAIKFVLNMRSTILIPRKRVGKLLKYMPHVSSTQSNTVLFVSTRL